MSECCEQVVEVAAGTTVGIVAAITSSARSAAGAHQEPSCRRYGHFSLRSFPVELLVAAA